MLIVCYFVLNMYAGEDQGFLFPVAMPEQVGMNKAKLEQAKSYALSAGGSGMILRHGRAVSRWGDQKKRYDIKSATKSFGATMLGVAIQDGKIELDAPAKSYHPTLGVPPQSNAKTGWLDKITIRHLATQTAGFDKPGGYEKLLFRPGTQWHYSDGGPNWLAECITLQYRRDLEDLMFERVFTPLGITRDDLRWRKNQYRKHEIDGIPRREFGAGIHANVEALARLGYLYLHNGCWKNQQILPKKFVEMASRHIDSVIGLLEWSDKYGNASDHYSLLWWNNVDGALEDVPRDAYWAWGLYDSLIVVIPSLDLIVVRGGERGRRLPREDGANHYEVLGPLLRPVVAAVFPPRVKDDKDENEAGFVSLFDGRTFDHWLNPTSRWSIRDGRMVFSGEVKSGGLKREDHKLMSVRQYEDFILRFEFKIGKRANSGVAIRAPLKGDAAFVAMEIQIIDNHYWKGLKSWQKHGSIYGVVKARTGHLKQPGEWNTEEILCQGSYIKVTLNGAVIVDADLKDLPDKTLDGKNHPGLKRTRGRIGFLPHTKSSEYRNIRIKELHPNRADDQFPFPSAQPEQVAMDKAKLESARKYAQTGGGSGCIIRGGQLIMAWGDQKQKYDIYSSTKSISITALGLAIMDSKIKMHDNAIKYLPSGIPPV